MSDLRELVEDLGYGDVRTLLNSGTSCSGARVDRKAPAARIEDGNYGALGISARVTVLTAGELAAVRAANTLGKTADDPSRLLVTF